ncbi:acetylxylan esterase [Mucilaginibacter paludis]|uniref:Acetyl xylan esterase n=1 Tax=Mucilaginibacter paludis DSM 18603 TaxID=714943 RepID=H1Y703_9SPHI|nr:alpha/beta fold hydrolase [Mucilaginibacter paludis]EHQ28410.1 Acetyl xylan esterase [Mucilaginibacter paludis DSM 18603]
MKLRFTLPIIWLLVLILQIAIGNRLMAQAPRQRSNAAPEVVMTEHPLKKDAIFKADSVIGYHINLQSSYKTSQKGTLSYLISTPRGKLINQKIISVNLDANATKTVYVEIPAQKTGFYKVDFMLNLPDYDDTVRRVFGVDIYTIKSNHLKPADFSQFWRSAKAQLAQVPPAFKVTEQPDRAQRDYKVYLVEMKSLGNITVRGWMTIPKNKKLNEKLPVYMVLPGYGANLDPIPGVPNFACIALNVRGLGNSRDVVNPSKEDFITYNIHDKNKYILRGAIMDCERMLDFISGNADLDAKSIFVTGGSMGGYLSLVLAGLDNRVAMVAADNPTFSDFRWTVGYGTFPMSAILNFAKLKRLNAEQVLTTLDYFDLKNFMPTVKANVLMAIGLLDNFAPPNTELVAYNSISSTKKLFIYSNLGHEIDQSLGSFKAAWLYNGFHMFNRVTALGQNEPTEALADTATDDDNSTRDNSLRPIGMVGHPGAKNAEFSSKSAIYYNIDLKNNFDKLQKGMLSCEIMTVDNQFISLTSVAVKLAPKALSQIRINLPSQSAGKYKANFILRTGDYTDTLRRIFRVDAAAPARQAEQRSPDENETVSLTELPGNKEAIFKSSGNIFYNLDLKNHFNTRQQGKVSCEVSSMDGKSLSTSSFDVDLAGKASKQVHINLPAQLPGFYKVNFMINVNDYDDTVRRVFGVDIYNINSKHPKPADFDEFWATAKKELSGIEPRFRMIEKPELSKDGDHVFLIEMQSIGNLTVRGWMTLPKDRRRNQKLPVYIALPGYGANLKPIHDMFDFAALALNVRGLGNSNDVLKVGREEFLTKDITNRDKYILRGAIMDCVRMMDFVYSRPECDATSIFVNGGSMGGYLSLVLASLDSRVTICSAGNPAFSDWREMVGRNEFPMGSIQNYARQNDEDFNKILNNLDYFDLKNFVDAIKCKSVVGIGLLDVLAPPNTELPAYNNIKGKKKIFIFPNLGHQVGDDFGNFSFKMVNDNFGLF